MPAESAGADRQKRLYLALVFVLFVPTAAVFAWNDWVAGKYLQQETGTLVSHGICEECARRLDADPEHRGRAGAPGTTPGDGARAGGGEAP
jgi:hypothetical protein